jgi:hypothetical protein
MRDNMVCGLIGCVADGSVERDGDATKVEENVGSKIPCGTFA